MSDMDVASHANAAWSGARERSILANTVPEETGLWALEEDLAPCRLSFAEADDAVEPRKTGPQEPRALTIDTETVSAEPEDAQQSKKSKDVPKPFDVTEIPSPTRNRAKRQAALLAQAAKKEEEQQSIETPAVEQHAAETLQEYHHKVVGEIVKSETEVFQ